MDRASDFGSEGWGFESLRARINYLLQLAIEVAPTQLHQLHGECRSILAAP
jgi:hypothetical protein